MLESKDGTREMKLEKFIRGYRDADRLPNEIIREIIVPVPAPNAVQKFYKRGSRKALTLSRISLGLYAEVESGIIWEFRAGAGSMSPTPIRLPRLEAVLKGKRLTADLIAEAAQTAADEVNPRKSSLWRKNMTANLVRRFLEEEVSAK